MTGHEGRVIFLNGTSSAGKMLLSPDIMTDWKFALGGLRVLMVRVTCPLEVAEERERGRRHPIGLASGHFRTVHEHPVPYDMTLDTTTDAPADLARAVLPRAWSKSHLTRP